MGIITELILATFNIVLGPTKILSYPAQINDKIVECAIMSSVYNFQLEKPPTKHPIYLALADYQRKGVVYVKRMPKIEPRNRPNEFMLFLLVKEQDDAIVYKYEPDISVHVVHFMETFFKDPIFLQTDFLNDIPKLEGQLNTEIVALMDRINNQLQNFLKLENKLTTQNTAFPKEQKAVKERDFTMKLAVLGDPSVGKTSSIIMYTDRAFRRSYIPTVGVNITEKRIETPNSSISVMIWDLAGHIKFNLIRKHYYSGATGVLLLFDLTNLDSFKSISDWYQDLNEHFARNPIPIILVGNKSDLIAERKVSPETIRQFLDQTTLKYIETSAKTGQNINSAFDLLIAEIIKQLPN